MKMHWFILMSSIFFCDHAKITKIHFTLLTVWDYKLIPATIKRQWREHASEGAVWKKALLMKTEWRKDKVQRGNPLFKCQAVGAILSPALISSFLRPSGLRFLTFVSPSWPFACLCRWAWLNTCQVTTDVHHLFGWRGGTYLCYITGRVAECMLGKSKAWRNSVCLKSVFTHDLGFVTSQHEFECSSPSQLVSVFAGFLQVLVPLFCFYFCLYVSAQNQSAMDLALWNKPLPSSYYICVVTFLQLFLYIEN